ncbi:MAG: hypothetical protein IKP77_06335 [Acholeplasmatales bacterium]|nr:hypothetical protein [Acholeplasmatales bacterium]
MQRFKNVICHPSRIGLYHKDSPLMVLVYLVLFLGFLIGMLAVKTYNTDYFDYSDSSYVVSLICNNKNETTCEYKNHKLIGSSFVVTDSEFECYFLSGVSIENIKNSGIVFIMNENDMKVYYGYGLLKSINYSDIDSDYSFSINDVRNNESSAIFNIKGFYNYVFNSINLNYANNVFIGNILSILRYYLIFSVLVLAVYSYFINPSIAMGVRAKLVIYDSLVYFIVMFFMIVFEAKFLQYVALIFPLIYCSMTFSHILRVRK